MGNGVIYAVLINSEFSKLTRSGCVKNLLKRNKV